MMNLENAEGTLRVNGADIWYKVLGSGPVLMLQAPGWGIGSGLYQQTLADLSAHYTLVWHDPRGSGASISPSLDYATVNVGVMNDDLEALRQHLRIDRFVLLGHSHGGFVAVNHALKYPRHLAGLVLVDAQLGVEEPGADLARTLPKLAAMPQFADAVAAFTGPRKLDSDADLGAFLKKIGGLYFKQPDSPAAAVLARFVDDHRISLAAFAATSSTDKHFLIRDRLAELQVPTLVMVGSHDFICSPVQAQVLADGIVGARLVEFADSGHMCWIEEPQRFRLELDTFMRATQQ
ncbi:alpha/beta fold hydrolase [Duganella callida]|uniref:Alpha/beta hydrolase n=1 Tax=Duganella callida TaxID=2561932 RepID=A0A4Y9S1S9_9BURK|nr:alpha/beta hydrolase [Duganella callida]TFW15447.1 alpha/beta hydrolase [Duganella callida]